MDSAIAALFCLGVYNMHSAGVGGGGFMVVYKKSTGLVEAIDFREEAPGKATRTMYVGGAMSSRLGKPRFVNEKWSFTVSFKFTYYNYQLSNAPRSFGDEVLNLKYYGVATANVSSLPIVTISSPAISRALLPMTSKTETSCIWKRNQLPLTTTQVER